MPEVPGSAAAEVPSGPITNGVPIVPGTLGASEPAPVPTPAGDRRRWVIAGLIAVAAIAGALAAALILGARPLPEGYRYLPADSVAFLELRPDLPGDQRQHLGNFLAHFPGFADQSILPTKLDDVYDRIVDEASGGAVDYRTRVKPLLTGPVVAAIGVGGYERLADGAGLLVAATDGVVTCETVFGAATTVATHRSVEVHSVDGDLACAVDGRFMLVGDAATVRAGIDAHADQTGADTNQAFRSAREQLAGDQLGIVYVDGQALVGIVAELAPGVGLHQAMSLGMPDWIVMGLRVVDDAVQLDILSAPLPDPTLEPGTPTDPPPSVSQFVKILPADTWAFVEVHGAGAGLQRLMAQAKADPAQAEAVRQIEETLAAVGGIENVAAWIEEVGIAVMPVVDGAGGAILLRGSDDEAVRSRFTQVHNLLLLGSAGTDITVRDSDHDGVTITQVDLGDLGTLLGGLGIDPGVDPGVLGPDARLSFSLAARDDVLFLGIGEGTLERILDTTIASSLSSTAAYRRVIELADSPNDVEIFVAIDGLISFAETYLPAEGLDTWKRDLKPYLEHLAGFGGTTLITTTGGRARFVITVQ